MAKRCHYNLCSNVSNLLVFEEQLGQVSADDVDVMGRLVHRAAAAFMPVDAFYICLWDAEHELLRFAYNFDTECPRGIDGPCVSPLGSGPTSYVVRNRRTYMLDPIDRAVQDAGALWGHRLSEGAIHVPIVPPGYDGSTEVLGVFSVQTYEPNVYGKAELELVEWIGRRVGAAIVSNKAITDLEGANKQLGALSADKHRREVDLVNSFVGLFDELDEALASLTKQSKNATSPLCDEIANLGRLSQRLQAKATYLDVSTVPMSDKHGISPLSLMSPRERELLPHLAAGTSYKEIAANLNISVSTVKFHLSNILDKLNIQTRSQLPAAIYKYLRNTNVQP